MEKKQAIQILRAAAALGVVLYHLLDISAGHFRSHLSFGLGRSGVDVFFVISGFVIAASGLRDRSPIAFLRRRIARVIPLYWLLTLAGFLVGIAVPGALKQTSLEPAHLLKSLLFITDTKGDQVILPILYLGWTLNYEMYFYVAFGICLAVTSRPILLMSAVFISIVLLHVMFPPHVAALSFYSGSIMLEFIYGLALYQLTNGGSRIWTSQWILLPVGGAMLCAAFFFHPVWPRCIVYGVPAATIVAGALGIPNKDWRFLRWGEALGDASYSIYLVHFFLIGAATILVKRLLGAATPGLALLTMTVVVLPGTIISSLALYRFFERPMNRWLSGRHAAAMLRQPAPVPQGQSGT